MGYIIALLAVLLFAALWLFLPRKSSPQQLPEVINEVSREQVLHLVREGDTEEALDILAKTGNLTAIHLRDMFKKSQQKFSAGLIVFEDWAVTRARTNYTIVEMIPKSPALDTLLLVPVEQVKELAEGGKLEEALLLLLPGNEEFASIQLASLRWVQKYRDQKLVSDNHVNTGKARVKYAILEVLK
ncbi:MAG: hypothetical protein IPH04_01360 [Saprospirales bacterium]|nr:hypothetical protein [Saprospirales bacterium]